MGNNYIKEKYGSEYREILKDENLTDEQMVYILDNSIEFSIFALKRSFYELGQTIKNNFLPGNK